MKNALIDHVTLTFNPKSMSLLVYPKAIPCTMFENFGIIHFLIDADRQTDGLENPTDTDRHSLHG